MGSGSGGWWCGGLPVKSKRKGKGWGGWGGGVGTGKGTGKSLRKLCRNYPLAIYPLVSPLTKIGRTPRGSCNRTLLRRVLRRLFEGSAS